MKLLLFSLAILVASLGALGFLGSALVDAQNAMREAELRYEIAIKELELREEQLELKRLELIDIREKQLWHELRYEPFQCPDGSDKFCWQSP